MTKCGVSLLLNKRFENYKNDSAFLEKVFHSFELRNEHRLADIFVIKEAVMKALGKEIDWKDIEVNFGDSGKPLIYISESARPEDFKKIDGSVSQEEHYTIGFVVIELEI